MTSLLKLRKVFLCGALVLAMGWVTVPDTVAAQARYEPANERSEQSIQPNFKL